jgi:SAM-dependent methyltransferase
MTIDPASPMIGEPSPGARSQAINLFLTGFLVLFLELACIRWFAAYVVFLQFFTNVVLIASFLGMSCGCLAARSRRDWLGLFPFIALGSMLLAVGTLGIYGAWHRLAIDVGGQAAPQEIFFGAESRNPDVAQFVVPIELIAGIFFVLIALMFVGLGQVLGRAFDAYPNRVQGYTLNIGGSLAGIVGFSVLSFAQAPPGVWFSIICGGIAYLLGQGAALTRLRALALVAIAGGLLIPFDWVHKRDIRWSPYYMVDHKPSGSINVNTMGHQVMLPFEKFDSSYSIIHLLQRNSGGAPFKDVLIIGAGTGNDIAHATHFGVSHIDAVEIDPAIQDIGVHFHPDHPYQDARVTTHLDDGRHFLRTTERKYDLVVYALLDSLILHSSYGNLRLESYLFTKEAFEDVRRVLKPDGTFVIYNYLRQGWIVDRIAAMAEDAFGCASTILSLPYRATLKSSERTGFTVIVAGCDRRIADAFAEHGSFWLADVPTANLGANGFTLEPDAMPVEQRKDYQQIAPTRLVNDEGSVLTTSDDWPFLYLHSRLLPDLTVRSMVLLAVLGLGVVYFFRPKGRGGLDSRMFFLGAAFMLIETRAVVQMALLFGSTWLVNSMVFFTVLVMILLANLYVLKVPNLRLPLHYGGLLLFLVITVAIPLDTFLNGGVAWRYVVPCVLTLGPMFFAGVIFARTFRDARDPDRAFGSNIAGSVLGGLSESFSTVLGFRHLLLLALAFYILSIWTPGARRVIAIDSPSGTDGNNGTRQLTEQ